MHARATLATLTLVALSAWACGNVTEPTAAGTDIQLNFCGADIPSFFAVQNGTAAWARITADAAGTFAFKASDKTTIAIVHQAGSDYDTEVFYMTAQDLQPLNGTACANTSGSKTLTGSVANVPVSSGAE